MVHGGTGDSVKLEQHEISSPLFQKLKKHYEDQIAGYRLRNENPRISEAERIELCWKIDSIKKFFALAEPSRKKESGAE